MFWLRFARLLASVAWEGVYSLFCLFAFLFLGRRRVWRERIASEMRRGAPSREMRRGAPSSGSGAVAWIAISLGVLVAPGCTQFPGASFERQVENTVWSARVLADQTGEFEGLLADLRKLFFDPEWDQLPGTFEQLGW